MNKNVNIDSLPPSHYLEVENLSEENNVETNPYFSRKTYVICFIAIFGLTLLFGTLIATAKDTIEESESENISTAEEIIKEFCSEGIGSDDIIREQMAEDFRKKVEEGDTSYSASAFSECIPEKAYSHLKRSERKLFRTLKTLAYSFTDIYDIHPNAFEEDIVGEIETLILWHNEYYKDLPESVFKPFKSLRVLKIYENHFDFLNSRVFGEESSLEYFYLNTMNSLEAFPELMIDTPHLKVLQILGANALFDTNKVAFENLKELEKVEIGSAPATFLGVEDLAEALGIDASILFLS